MLSESEFDFIVVGGGTAGCVVAGRLAEDERFSVLLLEAGCVDRTPLVHIPFGYYWLIRNPSYCHTFHTTPQRNLRNRRIPWPRGRVLGGCSSVNGLVYIRGQPEDYDEWDRAGGSGWSWENVLPCFKAAEDAQDLQLSGQGKYGSGGPIGVSVCKVRDEISDAFVAAASEAGFSYNNGFNGDQQGGVGYYDLLVKDGLRSSTARGYVRGRMRSRTLRIVTGAQVESLCMESDRATGVRYVYKGRSCVARSRMEVIVCGGAIESPLLLMRSGIGDPIALETKGIEVRHKLRAVGASLQDHLQVRMVYRCRGDLGLNKRSKSSRWKVGAAYEWLTRRSGPLGIAAARVGLFASSTASRRPDVQFHVMPFSADIPGAVLHDHSGFTISICSLRPSSRGHICLGQLERDAPLIDPAYLSVPEDVRPLLSGMQIARDIVDRAPLRSIAIGEIGREGDRSEQDDEAYIRATATTIFHPVGTCRMGVGEDSVVDSKLCVHGVRGLRVVDASVMPSIVSGNTCAPTIAIAERAARLIRDVWR